MNRFAKKFGVLCPSLAAALIALAMPTLANTIDPMKLPKGIEHLEIPQRQEDVIRPRTPQKKKEDPRRKFDCQPMDHYYACGHGRCIDTIRIVPYEKETGVLLRVTYNKKKRQETSRHAIYRKLKLDSREHSSFYVLAEQTLERAKREGRDFQAKVEIMTNSSYWNGVIFTEQFKEGLEIYCEESEYRKYHPRMIMKPPVEQRVP